MANACFRCKAPIESGPTFCADCRVEASLEFPYERDSRLWVVVAAVPALLVALAVAGVTAAFPLGSGFALYLPLALAFAYALYRDCQHVRRRDDADWEPSEWLYAFLALFSVLLVLPIFLVAPYHLHRRRSAIGLVLWRSEN